MYERRIVRQVVLNYAEPRQESIIGDLNGKDTNTAIWLGEGQDRVENVTALESLLAPVGE